MTYTIRCITGAKFLWFDPPDNAVNGMENEGFLFIEDLSAADPTLILPILVAVFHIINIEVFHVNQLGTKLKPVKLKAGKSYRKNIIRILGLGFFYVCQYVPAVS
jgi:membrane protein insertase Oxa1/YidC/SpoIIIJ